MTSSINRRTFLELLPAVLAIAPTVAELGLRGPADTSTADPSRLRDVFGHQRQSALVIGRHYLDQCPAEADSNKLVDTLLLGEAGSKQHGETPNAGDLLAFFQKKFAEDFDQGNTVMIDGWVLSKTEARLCARMVIS